MPRENKLIMLHTSAIAQSFLFNERTPPNIEKIPIIKPISAQVFNNPTICSALIAGLICSNCDISISDSKVATSIEKN